MKTVIVVVLILVAYFIGRGDGFYGFQRFLHEEYPDVLDALWVAMDKKWED